MGTDGKLFVLNNVTVCPHLSMGGGQFASCLEKRCSKFVPDMGCSAVVSAKALHSIAISLSEANTGEVLKLREMVKELENSNAKQQKGW